MEAKDKFLKVPIGPLPKCERSIVLIIFEVHKTAKNVKNYY